MACNKHTVYDHNLLRSQSSYSWIVCLEEGPSGTQNALDNIGEKENTIFDQRSVIDLYPSSTSSTHTGRDQRQLVFSCLAPCLRLVDI